MNNMSKKQEIIGLIDADLLDNGTRHPNLVLLKLAGFFHDNGIPFELILDPQANTLHYTRIYLSCVFTFTKLLQKSEMRKNMVMDLIYRGFIYAANYSESHYNPRRSQIKTELRYLFVTTPNM